MKYFLITDTHFNHDRMYGPRGWRYPMSAEVIWKNLEQIPDDATVIHLGDFAIYDDKSACERYKKFKFKKVLIRGNHDRNSCGRYMENGFDFCCDSMTLNYMGKKILFSHIPAIKKEGDYDFDINIHGHFHDVELGRCMSIDFPEIPIERYDDRFIRLSLEREKYLPVKLDSFVSKYGL